MTERETVYSEVLRQLKLFHFHPLVASILMPWVVGIIPAAINISMLLFLVIHLTELILHLTAKVLILCCLLQRLDSPDFGSRHK